MAKAPARKDFRENFPLRGFVTCAECGAAYIACWSKGRSTIYPYYLCDTRGCPSRRKSIRREVIDGEFATLLASLQPSASLFNVAFHMFRDLWNAKPETMRQGSAGLKQEVAGTSRKIDQLLDRIVDATSDSVIAACARKIKELETQKAVLTDQMARSGKPAQDFGAVCPNRLCLPCKPFNTLEITECGRPPCGAAADLCRAVALPARPRLSNRENTSTIQDVRRHEHVGKSSGAQGRTRTGIPCGGGF